MSPATRIVGWSLVLALGIARLLPAQHEHAHSPYAGMEGREIKALSDSQIAQLRSGDGMSLALPAELNHYPGPRHVLDLARQLDLSSKQRRQVQAIEQAMRSKARELGSTIIERERELDRGFADGKLDEAALRRLTAEIARLLGDLRYVHLSAHVELRRVLTAGQVERYEDLRGYRKPG